MTKQDLINEVVVLMGKYLDSEGAIYLNNILTMKLHNVILTADETLPSCEVKDNEYLIKRFIIDQTAKGLSNSSIKQYVVIVKQFFAKTGLSYHDVTGQDITDYLAIRQVQDGISQSYKGTISRYLSVFFGWAYRKHHIDEDIMRDVDKVKFKQKKKERLTDEEIEQCRDVVKNNLRSNALLELMIGAGMRVGEIANLNIDDLDFQSGTIRIWGEKTDEYRTGFMSARMKLTLRAYIGDRISGPVFIGRRGKGKLTNSTIETIAKKIAADAGCHCKATVHTYRKTFASVMYRKTGDVLLVSKLLGHSGTDVTVKYYLVDDVAEMQNKVNHVA